MWGGLGNRTSPGGIGLIRSLCNTKTGRESIANVEQVILSLCKTSRSSDDWQYMAIDSLLLLLKDTDTRYKVIDVAALFLADLVELRSLNERTKIGEAITQTLLQDYHKIKYGGLSLKSQSAEEALKEIWELKNVRHIYTKGVFNTTSDLLVKVAEKRSRALEWKAKQPHIVVSTSNSS
ncbi:hypothetical protein GH714_015306 [Hevea brasiliensis]|uniref:Uncharacterized protein n=1 Tax=Hevea brasiliensis TaxID=3981 RepID=A0A6A6LDN4_HEVBR|nr:hypothetical protein GH714_015306 [Hevea brasiliensis]